MYERRKHPRANVIVSIRTTDPCKRPAEQSTNLSETGMFVQTDDPYPLGTMIGVELSVQSDQSTMFLKARVVRQVNRSAESPAGMGVEFVDVPPRELSRLRRLIWGTLGGSATITMKLPDQQLAQMLQLLLVEHNHKVTFCHQWSHILTHVSQEGADLLIADVDDLDEHIHAIQNIIAQMPVIGVCVQLNGLLQAKAAAIGIFELLEKPVGADALLAAINREIQSLKLRNVASEYQTKPNGIKTIVARSPTMQEVLRHIIALAPMPQPVLIIGETGVGKEVVARTLWEASVRRTQNYQIADCTMMDKNLMASMLFGHEKGSFTGSLGQHQGLVEQAQDGVLFLDEIGELSTDCQSKLLRLLENGTYRRLGGARELVCKARIIAASNRDLRLMVRDGDFREDLLYRLQVHSIVIPPLRERREDIVHLAYQLLNEINHESRTSIKSFSPRALMQLTEYHWPGNIRELRNTIAASLVHADNGVIPELRIHTNRTHSNGNHAPYIAGDSKTWKDFLSYTEKQTTSYLTDLMIQHKGVISEAAQHAGMTRQNLSKKLKEHGIRPSDYKNR